MKTPAPLQPANPLVDGLAQRGSQGRTQKRVARSKTKPEKLLLDTEEAATFLNQILQEDSDRLWKDAQAREKLSKPTLDKVTNLVPSGTEESDAIRRKFAPVLKARSEAVRQSIDPNRQALFPASIEFGSPQPGLKLSYQK